MDLEIRPIANDEEFDQFIACDAAAFAYQPTAEGAEEARALIERPRTVAAFESGRVVGSSANLSLELTVPGGFAVPVAGLTWVGVMPTRRRQGVLRAMMQALLQDAVDHRESMAVLLASESLIYGRFGFGAATFSASYEIDRRHAEVARQPGEGWGGFEMMEPEEAAPVLRGLFDRCRVTVPGEISRPDAWWPPVMRDPETRRGGGARQFHVVHRRGSADPDGYVRYRYHHRWDGVPDHTVEVIEIVAANSEARMALMAFCLDLDLASHVRLPDFPVDEPLRWALRDQRRLRTVAVNDMLWVRLVDVPAALESRTYLLHDAMVFAVEDRFLPRNRGNYELVTDDRGARCTRSDRPAELELDVSDLGAAYLGGVSFSLLAAAGRVREVVPGALARADLMFATERRPFTSTDF